MNERAANKRFAEVVDLLLFAHKQKMESIGNALHAVEANYDECLQIIENMVSIPAIRTAIYAAPDLENKMRKYVNPRDHDDA